MRKAPGNTDEVSATKVNPLGKKIRPELNNVIPLGTKI
jgi:hypothetical protein